MVREQLHVNGVQFSEMDMDEIEEKLMVGWEWMKKVSNGDKKDDFYNEKWIPLLRYYTATYGGSPVDPDKVQYLDLPETSPWIEELREQLTLGGIADVEPAPKGRLQS